MAQVTIYIPDELMSQLKRKVQSIPKSLSAYFTDLVRRELRPSKWPKTFIDLYGSIKEFPPIEDLSHKEIDVL